MDLERVVRANILRLREDRKWTQSDLAIQVNKSRSWVAHIESGKRKVTPHLELFATVFDVEIVELVGNGGEPVERYSMSVPLKVVIQSFIGGFYEDYEVLPTVEYIRLIFDVDREVAEKELFIYSVREMISA